MLNAIAIQNFRGFAKLAVAVPPVLAVMGPNSSGKTTLLQAIRLACDALPMVMESEDPIKLNANGEIVLPDLVVKDTGRLLQVADWQALFVDQAVAENVAFEIKLTFDDNAIRTLTVKGVCARNTQLKLKVSVTGDKSLADEVRGLTAKSAKRRSAILSWLQQHAPRPILVPPFYGVVRDEEYRSRAVVDNLVGSSDQSHVVRNLVASLSPEQFVQLNSFLRDMVGAELCHRTQGGELQRVPRLRVTFKDSNGEIELSAAGAGLVNLVAIYSSLARYQEEAGRRPLLFLLDEPEAHLHPKLQGDMADRLATVITRDFGAQVIMATHSVDIINRIASREDAALFRSDRLNRETGGVELVGEPAVLDDLSGWADLTPFSTINFLASKRVLFHEGASDAELLRKCAEIKFRNRPNKRRAFEKWSLVSLGGSGNERVVDLLSRLVQSAAVPTNPPPGSFKVAMVLDKDYHREATSLAPLPDSPMAAFCLVWPRHSIESLFLEQPVLEQWLSILYPVATERLPGLIQQALAKVNQNKQLNDDAQDQRQIALVKQLGSRSDAHLVQANSQARTETQAHPEIWQRGKDRASAILLQIKDALGPVANNMTTDLPKLFKRADVNRFPAGNDTAIPREIGALLDWLATES